MLLDRCGSFLKLMRSDWEEQKPYWNYEDIGIFSANPLNPLSVISDSLTFSLASAFCHDRMSGVKYLFPSLGSFDCRRSIATLTSRTRIADVRDCLVDARTVPGSQTAASASGIATARLDLASRRFRDDRSIVGRILGGGSRTLAPRICSWHKNNAIRRACRVGNCIGTCPRRVIFPRMPSAGPCL
jgi:hypothetical protein